MKKSLLDNYDLIPETYFIIVGRTDYRIKYYEIHFSHWFITPRRINYKPTIHEEQFLFRVLFFWSSPFIL